MHECCQQYFFGEINFATNTSCTSIVSVVLYFRKPHQLSYAVFGTEPIFGKNLLVLADHPLFSL